MLKDLETKVKALRQAYVDSEAQRKAERSQAKAARDYEIFTEMPYKLSSRKFTLGERHPISKTRVEAASAVLEQL